MRRALAALCALALLFLAACSSTSSGIAGTKNVPDGIDKGTWADFCSHEVALNGYLDQAANGTLTADEVVAKLGGSQEGIQGDAQLASGAIATKLQALADAVGRAKVAVAGGAELDAAAIVAADKAVPVCEG